MTQCNETFRTINTNNSIYECDNGEPRTIFTDDSGACFVTDGRVSNPHKDKAAHPTQYTPCGATELKTAQESAKILELITTIKKNPGDLSRTATIDYSDHPRFIEKAYYRKDLNCYVVYNLKPNCTKISPSCIRSIEAYFGDFSGRSGSDGFGLYNIGETTTIFENNPLIKWKLVLPNK